jgi:NAD(P)-dependent dehydrogenase (short-subunit alcohol dehydrogenase family)
MPGDFSGRTAFITGAAHGQGRATAIALAREGATIAAFDVARPLSYPGYGMGSRDDLDSLGAACRELGSECLAFAGDVRDDGDVTAAVDRTVERFGRIDILFNNAIICAIRGRLPAPKRNREIDQSTKTTKMVTIKKTIRARTQRRARFFVAA